MSYIHTIQVGEQAYPIDRGIDDTSVAADKTWSAQKILQQLGRLCPTILEQGTAVRCQPLEGYPLRVTAQLPETGVDGAVLTLCGKNLFDSAAYPFENVLIYDTNGAANSSTGYSGFKAYMPIGHLKGHTITLNHPGLEKSETTHAALVFYDADKQYISGSNGYTHTVPETAEYLRFSVPREYADGTAVQLELGNRVTQYEPYSQRTLEVQFPEPVSGGYVWEDVKPKGGVCTLWCDAGQITVEGKADPVAVIGRLTDEILALGGQK